MRFSRTVLGAVGVAGGACLAFALMASPAAKANPLSQAGYFCDSYETSAALADLDANGDHAAFTSALNHRIRSGECRIVTGSKAAAIRQARRSQALAPRPDIPVPFKPQDLFLPRR